MVPRGILPRAMRGAGEGDLVVTPVSPSTFSWWHWTPHKTLCSLQMLRGSCWKEVANQYSTAICAPLL